MEIKQEWFHNKSSYKAFLYAVKIVQELKEVKEYGGILYDDGSEIKGEWKVVLDPGEPRIGIQEGNCFFGYVGSCWDTRTGKTCCTKREVKEAFKNIRWVFPSDFHKISF